MEKVSVIIPVYKSEKYIHETLNSVIQQTYKNIEILIIDDESPDNSVDICKSFEDSRIKIIQQKNRGLSGARNKGIERSTGEYIAFIDSDDVWLPEKIEKHIIHFRKQPHLGISFSYSAFIDEKSQLMGMYQMSKLKNIKPNYILYRNPIGNGSAAVFRREVFADIKYIDNIHGYDEEFYFDENFRLSQDVECWIRIALQTSWQMEGIAEPLTLYRIHRNGISASLYEKQKSLDKVLEKTWAYAPQFIDRWGNVSRAYYSRYIARRAVSLKDGTMAIKMFNQAIAYHWKIFLEEPFRTLITGAAAYLIAILPSSIYQQLQTIVVRLTEYSQRQKIASSTTK